MTDTNQALVALMELVLAMVDVLEAPTATQARKAHDRMRAERREVEGWRETLHLMGTEANRRRLEQPTGQLGLGRYVYEGQAAQTAVAATERRLRAWQGLEPIEADDNRLTRPFREVHEARLARDPEYAAAWAAECASRQATGTLADIFGNPADSHKCCGGKPDCGCARSVGGD